MIKTENADFLQKPLLILPAAGFGQRAGVPGSKELILGTEGQPLISFHLEQARSQNWPVHLITRPEKRDLIAYLQGYRDEHSLDLHIQLITNSREWPDTVLRSQAYWRSENILCLPDTIYSPSHVLREISVNLQTNADICVAGFKPADEISTWGFVRKISVSEFEICEKPAQIHVRQEACAWGLLGFRAAFGKALFEAQLESTFDHSWKEIKARLLLSELTDFHDVTRKPQS